MTALSTAILELLDREQMVAHQVQMAEEWEASLAQREAQLAAAAEIRLEDPAVALQLQEAIERATLAERHRVVELIDGYFNSPWCPGRDTLRNLKESVLSPCDRTLDR